MTLTEYLTRRNACGPSIPWVAGRPASEALWRECPAASWMLWLYAKVGVRRELMVLCGTGCVRSALHLVPPGEDRPRLAVAVAEAWAYGRATLEDVRAAANAANAAARAATYATYAGSATYAATAAAAHAAYTAAEDAAYVARVAYRAAYLAATAAAEAGICTREHALARYARGVREVIPWWHVADRLVAAGVEVER
uniref:Uncharacterized protein n=1 Tax=viral metagenome TaxID=1070528 RepID=A0A6M3J3N0_9ZZZZ